MQIVIRFFIEVSCDVDEILHRRKCWKKSSLQTLIQVPSPDGTTGENGIMDIKVGAGALDSGTSILILLLLRLSRRGPAVLPIAALRQFLQQLAALAQAGGERGAEGDHSLSGEVIGLHKGVHRPGGNAPATAAVLLVAE